MRRFIIKVRIFSNLENHIIVLMTFGVKAINASMDIKIDQGEEHYSDFLPRFLHDAFFGHGRDDIAAF